MSGGLKRTLADGVHVPQRGTQTSFRDTEERPVRSLSGPNRGNDLRLGHAASTSDAELCGAVLQLLFGSLFQGMVRVPSPLGYVHSVERRATSGLSLRDTLLARDHDVFGSGRFENPLGSRAPLSVLCVDGQQDAPALNFYLVLPRLDLRNSHPDERSRNSTDSCSSGSSAERRQDRACRNESAHT